jgi:lactate dehydrogenase-like 2-hydroxyacid dehydrogenase
MLPVTYLFFQYFECSMKPVVLQLGALPEWDEQPLHSNYEVLAYYAADNQQAMLAEHGARINAIVTRGEIGADKALIDACPGVKLISVYGVGYDAVAVDHCETHGISVTNTPDVLTGDVADLAVAMLLCSRRDMLGASERVRSMRWKSEGNHPLSTRVFGQRTGILGLGRIGFEVATRLSGFNMDIYYHDVAEQSRAAGWNYVDSARELAASVDNLFVTLAASAETRHIVDHEVIEALGPDGLLLNVSRASNIDEDALISALESGMLGAAALDVFENEPDIDPRWLGLDNVLLQPHHASGTVQTRQAMGQLLRDNLAAHFAGKPLLTPVTCTTGPAPTT